MKYSFAVVDDEKEQTDAVCEMLASTLITGAVGTVLCKAKLIPEAPAHKNKTQETNA